MCRRPDHVSANLTTASQDGLTCFPSNGSKPVTNTVEVIASVRARLRAWEFTGSVHGSGRGQGSVRTGEWVPVWPSRGPP